MGITSIASELNPLPNVPWNRWSGKACSNCRLADGRSLCLKPFGRLLASSSTLLGWWISCMEDGLDAGSQEPLQLPYPKGTRPVVTCFLAVSWMPLATSRFRRGEQLMHRRSRTCDTYAG